MADKAINLAPTETTELFSVYGRDDNVDNRLVQYPANQFAHAVGKTVSNAGEIPYINASGDYTALAPTTEGYNLMLQSGLPVWAVNPSSHRYITSQTASGATSIDFTSGFTSDYDSYIFLLIGVYPSTAGSRIDMRLSINAGSSFIATGYEYVFVDIQSGAAAGLASTAATEIRLTNATGPNNVATSALSGEARLILTDTKADALYHDVFKTAAPTKSAVVGAGTLATASRANAVRFLASSGNINGLIRMYGVKNT